jgi:hypothetical protein
MLHKYDEVKALAEIERAAFARVASAVPPITAAWIAGGKGYNARGWH